MHDVRVGGAEDVPAVRATVSAALEFDAEATRLPEHLMNPPADRDWTWLVAADGRAVLFASTAAALPGTQHGADRVGYIDLLAVHPETRGRGLGRALVTAAEQWHVERGITEVRLAGHSPCYAWPGIDVRYTPALCLAEQLGYERYQTAWNMTADLDADLAVGEGLRRLARQGIEVRAAGPGERRAAAEFARREWNDRWAWEVEHATGCHYAVRDGTVLGFAAWGARPAWFGPMGTAPSAVGLGIGRVLLRRCLAEQRAAGQRHVEIGWVGPLRFYSRAVGARVERVFALYRRRLAGAESG